MRRWIHRHKIRLVAGLLIAATLASTGISLYLARQQYSISTGGAADGRHGNSGNY